MRSSEEDRRNVPAAVLAMAGAALATLLYFGWTFGSWSAFERSIDFNQGSFEDFSGPYFETGTIVFERAEPAPGFYYSPFFAILLGVLVRAQGEASAWTWLAIEIAGIAAIAWLAAAVAGLRSAWSHALAGVAVLASFPLVHNFHWGQVSALLVALELGALVLWQRGRARAGALLLALAVGIKFHPALFFLPFVVWGERKSLRWGALFLALFLVAVPVLALGPAGTLGFYRSIARGLAAAQQVGGRWEAAANEQYLPAVLARLLPFEHGGIAWSLAVCTGLVAAGAHLWLLAPLDPRSPRALLLAFLLLWLTTPLVVPPAWPHYFSYLPICQLVLAVRMARSRPRGWLAAEVAIAVSILLASVPFFRMSSDPESYGRAGFLLWADLLLLPAAWSWLASERRESRSTLAAPPCRSTGLARDRDQAQAEGRR